MKSIRIPLVAALLAWGCQRSEPISPAQLVETLQTRRGIEAARILESRQNVDFEKAVVAGLQHANPRVRAHCARILGRWNDVTFSDALVKMLADPDVAVQRHAARGVAGLLDTEQLVEILRGPELSDSARLALADALLRDPLELTNPQFFAWVFDKRHNPELRLGLLHILYERRGVSRRLSQDPDLRVSLARSIQEVGRQVEDWALDPAQPVRVRGASFVLWAASQKGKAYAPLWAAYRSHQNQPALANAILISLGHTRAPQALRTLSGLLRDPGQPLLRRKAALRGLQAMQGEAGALEAVLAVAPEAPELREQLMKALQSWSRRDLRRCQESLRQLQKPEWKPFAEDLLKSLERRRGRRDDNYCP